MAVIIPQIPAESTPAVTRHCRLFLAWPFSEMMPTTKPAAALAMTPQTLKPSPTPTMAAPKAVIALSGLCGAGWRFCCGAGACVLSITLK